MKADQESTSRMDNEGGASRPAKKEERFDSSPIIAMFRDRKSAYNALGHLTDLGIRNENIGLAFCDASVQSPANDASTYRATGLSRDGSEADDSPLQDSFRKRNRAPRAGSPNTSRYDGNFEAKQYQSPPKGVMVSIQPEAGERQKIRDLMILCGAAA